MSKASSTTFPIPAHAAEVEDRRLSTLLRKIVQDGERQRISIGDLLSVAGDRAFGALLFIFAMPNILPIPIPGISAVLGLPLLYLTGQLVLGHDKPWLPRMITERSFRHEDFKMVVLRILPGLVRAERFLHPRLGFLVSPLAERLFGVAAFVLALLIFLPIPLGNMLPGLSIGLFAMGILARDGLAMVMGLVMTVISIVVVSGVVYAITVAALFVIRQAFGL